MIPYVDLKAQYASIRPEIEEAVLGVLESSAYVLGPEVAAFETEFAAFCGTAHGVACNSGTSALHLALLAAGVGPGDEVVTVPFTFVATVAAVLYTGARPVLVDIEPATYTMDPAQLDAAITDKTKAILPVHLYGQCADMDPIREIADRRGIPVIEDAAQAHGATYGGAPAGSLGAIACFSFYPGKNLGAYGEGGMVVCADDARADTMRTLRSWGERRRYYHDMQGFNYRMDGIQGAILRVKLRHLAGWTAARQRNADLYRERLNGAGVQTPTVAEGRTHVYHVFAIRTDRRDELHQFLLDREIQNGIHYPVPVHMQPAYQDLGYGPGDFPVSEAVASEILSLPMFPELTESQIDEVTGVIRTFHGS